MSEYKFDLTRKQNVFLKYLTEIIEDPLPPFSRMAKELRMSPSGVHRLMVVLLQRGYVGKKEGESHMMNYYFIKKKLCLSAKSVITV